MTKSCPNLCNEEFRMYLSNGINGEIFYCKKCTCIWSEKTWEKDKSNLLSEKVLQIKPYKKRSKKLNPSISMGLGM